MRYSTIAASLSIEKNAWSVAKSCIQIVRLIFHNHDRLEPSRGNNLQNMKTSAANSPAISFNKRMWPNYSAYFVVIPQVPVVFCRMTGRL